MTTEATLEFPRTVFHEDGVRNQRVETQDAHDRLMAAGCWRDVGLGHGMPEPPPPPPPPMTPEEKAAFDEDRITGLCDQCDGHVQQIAQLEIRANEIEETLGAVVDSSVAGSASVNDRIDALESRVKTLEQSRQGASGVTGAFQDRLNAADDQIAAVKSSMAEAGPVLLAILERLTALENKKPKGQQ